MATEALSGPAPLLSSFQTAVAIIPPAFLHPQINSLRMLYDKSYKKWPPHINVLYPFVSPEHLLPAIQRLRDLVEGTEEDLGFWLNLDCSGSFKHRQNATVFLSPGPHEATVEHPETASGKALRHLEGRLARRFLRAKGGAGDGVFRPHLTVGQTSLDPSVMDSLVSKAGKLVGGAGKNRGLGWFTSRLAVLKRGEGGEMEVVDEIILGKGQEGGEEEEVAGGLLGLGIGDGQRDAKEVGPRSSYTFSAEDGGWVPVGLTSLPAQSRFRPKEITVATYNTLIDSPHPPPIDRYPLLVKSILSAHSTPPSLASPSILCLQEVTDEFLSYILSNDAIRARYPLCTHSPDSVLPSVRNCVILASASCGPFEWRWLDFTERHKGAIVASLPRLGDEHGPLVVVVVHLSCGLTDRSVAAKVGQFTALTKHLRTKHSRNGWIVAGDFNLQSSKHSIESALANQSISRETYELIQSGLFDQEIFSDAWELCFGDHEEDDVRYEASDGGWAIKGDGEWGATFNPLSNPLAADRVEWSRDPRPQRYDRVLIKRAGNLRVRKVRRFGFPEVDVSHATTGPVCGSDHWGVKAVLDVHPDPAGEVLDQGNDLGLSLEEVGIDDQLLQTFVEASIPTLLDRRARAMAINTLKQVLEQEQEDMAHASTTPSRGAFPIILAPVGSYALGVDGKGSDVDCLCLSTISMKTFFQVARQRIRKFGVDCGVRLIRFVNAKVPMLELMVGDIKFDLQYCQASTMMVERWSDVPLLPPGDPMFSLPATNLKRLNAYRDAEFLLRTIPNIKVFRLAHRFIKMWAISSGISSSRFGYLGGFHITLLLARVCKLANVGQRHATAGMVVRLFFDHYSKSNWATDVIFDPEFSVNRYRRLAREPMVIASIHTPVVNAAVNATKNSVATMARELKLADEALKSGQWDLGEVGRREEEFLEDFGNFVKIDIHYWGNSLGEGKALAMWVESRVPLLLVELSNKTPSIFARVWPRRFVSALEADELTELRGFYLVGLSTDEMDVGRTKDEKRAIEGKFMEVLRAFEEQFRVGPLKYDANDSWIQVQYVGRSALGPVKVDDRYWDGVGDDEGAVGGSDDGEGEGGVPKQVSEEAAPTKRLKQPKQPKKPVPGKKLRPALDVINRIRWDSSLELGEFLVGYEDRFLGVREMEVRKWKMDQTDLEFIPLHRVVYFKRVSDGVVVWDRETKTDLIFGA